MPVYFIRSGDAGPVKIGWANDVETRRRYLQTAHPYPLQIVRVIQCRRGTEEWLHRHYEAAKILGEWFAFDASMLTVDPPDLRPAVRQGKVRRKQQKLTSQISWLADRCRTGNPCDDCRRSQGLPMRPAVLAT